HLVAAGLALPALHEVEDLLTRETLFALLRWKDGSFRFVAQPIAHDRPRESLIAAEQVLMDGLRMVDEWAAAERELPPETLVYRRRGSIEDYRRSCAGAAPSPPEAEQIFLLVDGRASVRRVIDLSRLGTFLGMRTFVELARAGWLEPVGDEAARGAAQRGGAGRLRRIAARAVPFAALAACAALARGGRAGGPVAGAPIARDPLAEARAGYGAARVRHLALATALARGRAPASLAELPSWPEGGGAALTAEAAAAYYLGDRDGAA